VSSINFATKEISVKIVFYGPGLCGKTTTLQAIYQSIKPERRPQMVSLATDVDRTIYFDFLPVNAYKIGDFIVRLQLYTVPGQVFYNSTRKLVLNGVDGVVFVADSQGAAMDDNRESLTNLGENLRELGMSIDRVPYVLQYNKRDLPGVLSTEELNAALNQAGAPSFSTVAITGEGVQEVLKTISRIVINDLTTKGVAKKVLPQTQPPPPITPAPRTGPATDLEAAINQAAPGSTVGPPIVRKVAPQAVSYAALWPTPDLRARCREVEAALLKGDYADAISSSWVLCVEATRPGVEAVHDPALEMLLRGVPGPRFVRYRELVKRARAGESVTLSDALFALHVAVELVV
jgi:signal recognition particle receptor subunit beta